MRKIKKKLDIKKRKNFKGFDKLIFLSMLEKFNKKFVYFPLYSKNYLNEYLITNRCAYTGRPRGVLRKYKLTRFQLKNFIYLGYIPGVCRKS